MTTATPPALRIALTILAVTAAAVTVLLAGPFLAGLVVTIWSWIASVPGTLLDLLP